mmetsp:Transcript_20283/g.50692  ORF Transcript_20283/g.50692 Transcript_20283/m.50692 type:complete len:243 (-) Transcript_20283:576-1304(-)
MNDGNTCTSYQIASLPCIEHHGLPSILVVLVIVVFHLVLEEFDEPLHDTAWVLDATTAGQEILVFDHVYLTDGHEATDDATCLPSLWHARLACKRLMRGLHNHVSRCEDIANLAIERLEKVGPTDDKRFRLLSHGCGLKLRRRKVQSLASLLKEDVQDGPEVVGGRGVHVALESHLHVEVMQSILGDLILFVHPPLHAPLQVLDLTIIIIVVVVDHLLILRHLSDDLPGLILGQTLELQVFQ